MNFQESSWRLRSQCFGPAHSTSTFWSINPSSNAKMWHYFMFSDDWLVYRPTSCRASAWARPSHLTVKCWPIRKLLQMCLCPQTHIYKNLIGQLFSWMKNCFCSTPKVVYLHTESWRALILKEQCFPPQQMLFYKQSSSRMETRWTLNHTQIFVSPSFFFFLV